MFRAYCAVVSNRYNDLNNNVETAQNLMIRSVLMYWIGPWFANNDTPGEFIKQRATRCGLQNYNRQSQNNETMLARDTICLVLVLIMTTRSQRKQRKDQNWNLRNLRNRPIQHRLTLVIAILIVLTRAGPMPIWSGVLYVCSGFTSHAQVKTSDIWERGRVKTAEIYRRL